MKSSNFPTLILAIVTLFPLTVLATMVRSPTPPPPRPLAEVSDIMELIQRSNEDGAVAKIETLLKGGYDVNKRPVPQYGFTPLTAAIQAAAPHKDFAADVRPNRYDAAALLLKYGADINQADGQGNTPLAVAAETGDIALTEELIARGADINTAAGNETYKRTPLEYAIPFGINSFHILMDKSAKYDAAKILEMMFNYIETGHEDFLELFLSYPVEIPADYARRLDYSTREKNPIKAQAVAIIRKHMALMEAAKKSGRPPHLLYKHKPPVTAQIVPPLKDPAIVTAVRNNDINAVKAALNKGADVNAVSSVARSQSDYQEGQILASPILHIALFKDENDIAGLLIDRGAKVNMTNADGMTPLVIAAQRKNLAMVKKLLAAGAGVDKAELQYDNTALENAGNLDIIQLLVAKGADVNHISHYGSVMHGFALNKNREALAFLTQHGGNINLIDHDMQTPLQKLIYNDFSKNVDIEFVKYLVSLGADLKNRDKQGFTAYDLAMQRDRKDIAAYLESAGAPIGDPQKVLLESLYNGNVAAAKKVLDTGFDVKDPQYAFTAITNIGDMNGRQKTPADALALLRLLAEHGADFTGSQEGNQGQTLLHQIHDPAIIDFLVEKGADVNAVTTGRETPLHVMARAGDAKAVAALLKNKAFPNAMAGRVTPLCYALQGPIDQRPADGPPVNWPVDAPPYLETIRELMEAGADPGLVDDRQCRPYGNDENYTKFRQDADSIINASKSPVARAVPVTVEKTLPYVPNEDVAFLFSMVSTHYLNREDAHRSGKPTDKVCDMPVMAAARKLYEANKDVAPDFKTFLDRLTLKGAGQSSTINGVEMLPWQYRGYNLLHVAAYYGDEALVTALLQAGMAPKARDAQGNSALFYATNGNALSLDATIHIMDLLLAHGVPVNAVNNQGESAIFTNFFMRFIQDQPTPHITLIHYLMEHGADPAINKDGNRNFADLVEGALKTAQKYGKTAQQEAYAKLLADLKAKGIEPHPPSNISPRKKLREQMEHDPLLSAVNANDVAGVKAALDAGADPNRRLGGSSALFSAVNNGDKALDIVKLMVEKGARLDEPAGYESLLARATLQDKHDQLVAYLLAQGLKPSPEDFLNMNSLTRSSMTPSAQKALRMILATGVDPNSCDQNGESPLYKAAQAGNREAVELLVRAGARTNACSRKPGESMRNPDPAIAAALASATGMTRTSILNDLKAMGDATPGCRLLPWRLQMGGRPNASQPTLSNIINYPSLKRRV